MQRGIKAGIIFLLIFCITFQFTAFDRDLYNNKQEEVLDYFYGEELPEMSEKETSHMKDVKNLHNYFISFIWFLIMMLGISFYFKPNLKFNLWIPLIIFGIILGLAYLFPSHLFEIFHKIFFRENYTFPATSVLKTLFPNYFFYNIFYITSIRTILITLVLIYSKTLFKKQ